MTSNKTLDFSPAPGAAPAGRRVLSHGLTETRLLVRNGEQLLLALIIPVAILVAARFLESELLGEQLPASVLALAVWSSAFTSVAIATGFERRYGVLERLAATPLGGSGLITGKALAVMIIVVTQLIILSAVAVALGWRPAFTAATTGLAIIAVLLAITAFVAFALILAGRLRAEATLALANVIYVVLLVAGGLVVPAARFPTAMGYVVRLLPTGALGEELRQASAGVVDGWSVLVLVFWAGVLAILARKVFRWVG
ncbi:ABC transporter permease [Microlunatus sp. Gsoil 973]|uniref:ABC transporter permease n=1 Tax=Microlunatus sp. Gsoil 973 TaxID=2672569 RepID=UPI0012B4B680|nr:ABC transporter permease [Microlunatus sp. Gsoil 973]QGN31975.1 ABC transporter permease [Microlunatus sp. Gsoil 973]